MTLYSNIACLGLEITLYSNIIHDWDWKTYWSHAKVPILISN